MCFGFPSLKRKYTIFATENISRSKQRPGNLMLMADADEQHCLALGPSIMKEFCVAFLNLQQDFGIGILGCCSQLEVVDGLDCSQGDLWVLFPLLFPRGAAGGEGSGQRRGSPHGPGTDLAVSHLCQKQRARIHPVSSPEVWGVKLQFLTAGFLLSGAQGAA